ncbi:transglutaminaseTgpA domain-containing protein [Variovorax sp. LARHSF232]
MTTPLKAPRRLAALPRDARDTLFLLCVIAIIVLPQVGNLPWWCSALTAVILVWRGTLAVRSLPLPGKWWRITLLALTLGATALTHRTLLGRDAGVTLVVLLLALKTLELRARRDAFVVFFLGFFAMLTNFFYSQSLPTALAMLVALLGLLTALVNAHLPVGRPPLLQSARMAGRMALLGAPIMLALFVLFPRMAPLWGTPSDAMTGRSGLSNSMRVGSVTELALDDGIAARVKFDGGKAPPQRELYFRGPVLSRFDGREWTFAPSQVPANLQVQGEPVRYEVTLEPNQRPWLLTLDAAIDAPLVPGMDPPRRTAELQWMLQQPARDLLRYHAESYPRFRSGPQAWAPGLAAYMRLPSGFNPRTLEMATQLREDPRVVQGGNVELVRLALERLRTGGYSYTLEPGVYGEHTADEFWFDRKAGFCEHIASAFVVLMRAAGVPARIVTGFQGGELNGVDGFWTLRNSDAHAWAEVWQTGSGWVRVDPTGAISPDRIGAFQRLAAPQGVLAGAFNAVNPTLAQHLRAAWEAINNGWNQWVLNYTQGRQLDLLKNIGFEAPSLQDLIMLLLALLVGASLAGALWTLWERSQHDPWLRLLARARARLQRAGLQLPESTPPREIARRVRERFGAEDEAAQAIDDWLLRLEHQRYSAQPAQGLSQLRTEFARLHWPR